MCFETVIENVSTSLYMEICNVFMASLQYIYGSLVGEYECLIRCLFYFLRLHCVHVMPGWLMNNWFLYA